MERLSSKITRPESNPKRAGSSINFKTALAGTISGLSACALSTVVVEVAANPERTAQIFSGVRNAIVEFYLVNQQAISASGIIDQTREAWVPVIVRDTTLLASFLASSSFVAGLFWLFDRSKSFRRH